MAIKDITSSDELALFRELFSKDGGFAQFGEIFQLNLILDANTILSEIRWHCAKREKQHARTSLLESINSSVIVAHAPIFLKKEVISNIPKIASEIGVDAEFLVKFWEEYEKNINFIDSGGPGDSDIDPKDVPYSRLHEATGYPIATRDSDLSKMGAKIVEIEVSTLTRDYSRNAAVQYKIAMAGIGTVYISQALIRSAVAVIKSLVQNVSKVPAWAWLLLIGGCIWAWSYPAFRSWLSRLVESLPENSKALGSTLLVEISNLGIEYIESAEEANRIREKISKKYDV